MVGRESWIHLMVSSGFFILKRLFKVGKQIVFIVCSDTQGWYKIEHWVLLCGCSVDDSPAMVLSVF